MLPGYNHNLRHRDLVFHVQTEDGGLRDPSVVTQLFIGGRCLAVRRWSYAHRAHDTDLEDHVRQRMMAMHKAMLRAVTQGEFDAQTAGASGSASEAPTLEAHPVRAPSSPPPPRSEAPTLEAPIAALRELESTSAAPAAPKSGRRRPAFEPATLSDDELMAEIDAELRRREPSAPRRPTTQAPDPARARPRRRLPSSAATLVEPPAVMEKRIEQERETARTIASPRRASPGDSARGRDRQARPGPPEGGGRPQRAEAPDAPTLEDVILDYLSTD